LALLLFLIMFLLNIFCKAASKGMAQLFITFHPIGTR